MKKSMKFRFFKGKSGVKDKKKTFDEKLIILDTMSEFIAYQDKNHKILFANKALREFSGLSEEEIVGNDCFSVWYKSKGTCYGCPIERALKSKRPESSIMRTPDGRFMEITGYPVIENNEVIGVVEVGRDVTEKIEAEQKLKKEKDKYEFLIENISDVVFKQGINLKIKYVSKSVEKYLGYSPDEIMEMDVKEIMTPQSYKKGLENINKLIEKVKKDGDYELPAIEYEYVTKDGKRVWGEMKVQYLKNKDGNITDIQGVIRDITKRKEIEKILDFERNQLLSIFNSIKEPIYVSDPYTYEILFVNEAVTELLGKNPKGELCYKAFQGLDEPCSFCTNRIILERKGETYQWEHYNRLLNKHFLIFDRIIRWPDGRDVRFEIAIDITKRKKMEDALRESENKYRALFENAGDGIVVSDSKGTILDVNKKFCDYLELDKEKIIGQNVKDFLSGNIESDNPDEEIIDAGEKKIPVETTSVRVNYKDGEDRILTIVRDISRRKELERQLNVSQKMEAVGRLTGGIAHDFNNLLTVILGNVELILFQKDINRKIKEFAEEIRQASNKAADLISQLLTYSRRQILKPVVIDLNELILNLQRMIKRIIGEDIELITDLDKELKSIKVDPSQMEQVIVNIIINAKDAMPAGGTIKIVTRNVSINDLNLTSADMPGISSGDYIMLSISDSGHGMSEDTKRRIFDPFFTTKGNGKGTGLGLSTVYGFIKQSGGYIYVESEEGKGATFKIFLPIYRGILEENGKNEPLIVDKELFGRGEKILIVEDESVVREMISTILEKWGYRVKLAEDGYSALKIINEEDFDLVITDVIMPGISGIELSERLKELGKDIKMLFMSGYSNNEKLYRRLDRGDIDFIQKPFSPTVLLEKIRFMLK